MKKIRVGGYTAMVSDNYEHTVVVGHMGASMSVKCNSHDMLALCNQIKRAQRNQ